jgi:hypothetical protein
MANMMNASVHVPARPPHPVAHEIGWLISNGLIAEGVHALWWFGTIWPNATNPGETVEGVIILAMIYVPFAFLLMYPLLRLGAKPLYARSAVFSTLFGAWLPGVLIAVVLLAGGQHIGRLFLPVMRLFE